jgi:Holliday junction resolvase RusA-like endonuclease
VSGERLLSALIPGPPVAQGRARLSRSGHHVMHAASRDWRAWAVAHIRAELGAAWTPLDEILAVDIVIVLARPATRPSHIERDAWRAGGALPCAGRGDVDNFCKAALDAAVDARVMTADHLVSTLTARKLYHRVGGGPYLMLDVRREVV